MRYRHLVIFPSAKTERGIKCHEEWSAKGYESLIWFDNVPLGWGQYHRMNAEQCWAPFPGYYKIINHMVRRAFGLGADLCTVVGDDMSPPIQGAQAVAERYFGLFPDGFGILQGCGDPSGMDEHNTPAAARICGSPTFGKGWLQRAHRGNGPFCDQYKSFYGDEDLWNVAKKCGVLKLDPEITIKHNHWSFGGMQRQDYHERAQMNWDADYTTFKNRKAAGFPGWEPL